MIARLAVTAIVTILWSGVASAVITTTGDAQVVSAPVGVVPPDYEEDGVIHVFAEQTDVMLSSDVLADMTVHYTTYNPPSGRTLGTIPMGTVVSSYYLHFDPVTAGGVSGSVTFTEPILAVIAEGDEFTETALIPPFVGDTLGPSNFLGWPGPVPPATTYPDNGELLGIEDGADRLTLYEATLSVVFGASNPGDRVRVLTAQTGTPVLCGNGTLDPGEGCDDGNVVPGDGCFGCQPEICFACTGEPSGCTAITTCVSGDGCCAAGCTPGTDTDCSAKCTEGKIKCVIKKKTCQLNCREKAAKLGVPVDSACLSKCSGKFDLCFIKRESKGGCSTTGDAPAIEAKVDAFVLDVATELDAAPQDDVSKCRANKLKCVDKYDKCVMGLFAKAAKAGIPIDAAKRAKCELKYNGGVGGLAASCFGRLEAKGGCETSGDIFTIQNKDDAFIDDVRCELGFCQ